MRMECPNFRDIIIPVESNFDAPDLGLPDAVRTMLCAEVQVRRMLKISSLVPFV